MKINELLTESISLSIFSLDCYKAINVAISKSIYQYLKQHLRSQDAFGIVLSHNLENILSNLISKNLENKYNVIVSFDEVGHNSANAQAITDTNKNKLIIISKNKFLMPLVDAIEQQIKLLPSDSEVYSILDSINVFDSSVFDIIQNNVTLTAGIKQKVSELTALVVHELTHLIQHIPQEEKIIAGELPGFEYKHIGGHRHNNNMKNYTDYLSVVQEIDANAQEYATQILNLVGAYSVNFANVQELQHVVLKLENKIKELSNPSEILSHKYKYLKNNSNNDKAVNRFKKKVYQEINRFLTQVKHNGNLNINNQ